MNPLSRRLAILRLKVRFLDGWQGICALITLVLVVGLGVGLLDFYAQLPTLVRAAALVGLLVGSAGIVYRYLLRPLGKSCNDLNLALRVEEEYPELNDSLASTVQFLTMTKEEQARLGVSAAMREQTVKEAIDRAGQCDFSRVLNRSSGGILADCFFAAAFGLAGLCQAHFPGLMRLTFRMRSLRNFWLGAAVFAGLGALAAAATVWALAAAHPSYVQTAFWRLVEPFGMHTWTQVAVYRTAPFEALDGDKDKKWEALDPKSTKEDRIAIGRPYMVKVVLTGQIPKQARVEIQGKIRSDMTITKLTPGEDEHSATFIAPINMTQQYQNFKFRVVANDGAFPPRPGAWHEVEVKHKPKLIDLDGLPSPQITIFPPAYTDLPSPAKLLPGAKHIEVYAGSRAVYRAKADRPLTQALIRWQPDDPTQLQLAELGAGAATVWDKAIATFDKNDKSAFTIPLLPWTSGNYFLYMRDEYGLESEEIADIRVLKDPLPVVKLLRPASSAEFAPDAVVPFKFSVSDEKFAVKSVFIEFRRRALDGKDLDENPTRTVLYESRTQGKLIPWQLAQAIGSAAALPDLRLRQPKLNFDMAWALKNHKFKEGEIVVVEVCAEDYCNIYPTREPGRSHAVELRIVSKREIIARSEEKLGQIVKDLQKAAKLEQKALDTVKEIRQEDKIDQAVKDKLVDSADQPQKDVRDMVGKTPEEGIRGELNKLRQTLKANGLDNTRPFKEAGEIKGALENIAQEELQLIEPKLNEIRNDLNQSDKNDPKTKAKLGETAKLQQNVADTLNELIGKMDPGAKMREQRIELRDILGKQQQLRDDEAKLKADKARDDKDFPSPEQKAESEKIFKNKVQQKAEEQRELAQRLEKLVKDMKAEQQQQEKLGNKKEAEQLKKAIDQIEKPAEVQKPMPEEPKKKQELPLNSQMKDVARDLRDKSEAPQQALDKQQNIAKQLEKALDTLEGKNPDLAKQEIKERKDVEKDIDQLAKKLKELRDKDMKADQIKDMQERLKKKQEIAKELENLQNDIEKTRRQLARLQEQQPANELKEANQKLDEAVKKMQQGENADNEQREAQKHLEEAKRNVEESEEELAREMLIKIADQLKGIKERQDGSLKRTEDLHPKVMKRKSWTEAYLDTLDGNIESQKLIAEETDGLKEKLKGAVVFGGILERAKKSMDDAGTVMEGRKKDGNDRRYIEKGDGEMMNAMELKDEAEAQTDTVKHQKQAARSLTNLLDALKEEIDKPKPPRPPGQEKPPDNNDNQPKGGVPNQDGIPPKAQLKALKAEQLDLNEKTADFHKRNPDPAQYNDRHRAELRELADEQDRLQRIFGKLTAPPKQEGDQP